VRFSLATLSCVFLKADSNPSAVNEVEAGIMQSFVVGANGKLSAALANVSSGGNGPAHLQALSTGEVSVMNVRQRWPLSTRTLADCTSTLQFGGGNGRIIEADAHDPAVFSSSGANITFEATKSNPHETAELANGELLVPDLVRPLFLYTFFTSNSFITSPASSL
jgi:anti-sigma factor RsiW